MLRGMTPLGDRLADADAAWWSSVLATVAGNLGTLANRAGRLDEAVDVLTLFLTTASACDPCQLKSSSVASKVQVLADALRGREQFAAALRALARALPLAPQHHLQLLAGWAKVKRDAARRQHTACLGETVPKVMLEVLGEQQRGSGDATDTARLLKIEVKQYVLISAQELSVPVRAALEQLATLPDLRPADRAWMLVTRTRTDPGRSAELAAADCAQAVAILTDQVGQDGAASPLALNLCVANYHLCLSRKRVEMEASKLSPLARLTQRPEQPDDEVDLDASCTVVPDYLAINLEREDRTESEDYPPTDLLAVVLGAARLHSGLGYRLQADKLAADFQRPTY
ncbi:uncharacterized protein LOC119089921 [Pollicipes pollicipes]|uniref:uncharacterized protein LOC119089921 n=1 Tax=Pollicipes pollicipes TaxID=41117 RepID=UPI0018857AF1|nr:uncharacterized protein LOC119089921 [Pollicipes pollicipes]